MQVLDREFGAWFFLQDGPDYYLDVNCDRGIVSFSISTQLTEAEAKLYAERGREYVDELAQEIYKRSDPGEPRQIRDPELNKRIYEAIMEWNKSHP